MLTINLLPAEDKRLVKLEESRRLILFLALMLTAVLIVGSALLAPSFLPLYLERRELERALRLEEEAGRAHKVEETMRDLRRFRSVILSIKSADRTPQKSSLLLEGLLKNTGGTVLLANLTVKKSGEVVFTGMAATRNDLLQFEKNLRDSGQFQDISSPLSNIIKETKINFTLQGKLKSIYGL